MRRDCFVFVLLRLFVFPPPQELFRDESKTEFVVVTIPSVLAVAETERLVAQLREQARTASRGGVNRRQSLYINALRPDSLPCPFRGWAPAAGGR